MDFKELMKPVRFGKVPADEVSRPFVRGQSGNRHLAALREAGEILTVLPGPGESLHVVMTGRYDLTDLLDVILDKMGTALHLRIATLSFNPRNSQRMLAWVGDGTVEKLTLLFSIFFEAHNPETIAPLREGLVSPHRLASARNHCKIICFHFADGQKLALEGSANLRNNHNLEQFALFHDPLLHDFHASWIDTEVSKNEGDTSRYTAKG